MRNVYIMNLKDNTCNGTKLENSDKFNTCYREGMLALGWTTEESREKDPTFEKVYKLLHDMKKGDLVWTRNPETKEYYICEVSDNLSNIDPLQEKPHSKYDELDISCFRSAQFRTVGTKEYLPNEITYRNLISRRRVRRVNNGTVIKATNDKFNSLRGNEND